MRATYTLPPMLEEVAALHRENKRLQGLIDNMEHFRSSAETALALEAEKERTAVVAWLRTQRRYGTDELLGKGWANVCNILADCVERGDHMFGETVPEEDAP